jgi:hypothetical protein
MSDNFDQPVKAISDNLDHRIDEPVKAISDNLDHRIDEPVKAIAADFNKYAKAISNRFAHRFDNSAKRVSDRFAHRFDNSAKRMSGGSDKTVEEASGGSDKTVEEASGGLEEIAKEKLNEISEPLGLKKEPEREGRGNCSYPISRKVNTTSDATTERRREMQKARQFASLFCWPIVSAIKSKRGFRRSNSGDGPRSRSMIANS